MYKLTIALALLTAGVGTLSESAAATHQDGERTSQRQTSCRQLSNAMRAHFAAYRAARRTDTYSAAGIYDAIDSGSGSGRRFNGYAATGVRRATGMLHVGITILGPGTTASIAPQASAFRQFRSTQKNLRRAMIHNGCTRMRIPPARPTQP